MTTETKPFQHQTDCLKKFGSKQYFALLAEQGTGKTLIIIRNAANLWTKGECDAVLVFAPNGVHTNWTRLEIPQHMPSDVVYRAAAWSASANADERDELAKLIKAPTDQLRVLTMNWESLQTKRGFEFAKLFISKCSKLMIVADESDAIKNPSAVRTKNLMKLQPFSKWRRIMTGTPINNSPFDAFSQFSFLHSSILGTTSYYAFKSEYAEMLPNHHPLVRNIVAKSKRGWAPQIVVQDASGLPRYRNLDKLNRLIAPHSFRVLKKDCLDLPEKLPPKVLFFDLTPEQREVYRKAEKECRLVFENHETPFTKLVAVMKLSQITSGYFLHPAASGPVRIDGGNPKLDMLMERVESITNTGDKIIIWARYRIEIADIAKRLYELKLRYVEYHGGVDKKARISAIDRFQNGDAQVFLGNQQAAGRGLTLVAASSVLYFSNNFSLRDRLQSEDRAHRIGQTKNVNYINFAAKGTIDEAIIRALIYKKSVADMIVDAGRMLK